MPSIQSNLERRLMGFNSPTQKRGLELTLGPVIDGSVSQNLVSGSLQIFGAASPLAKITQNVYSVVDGVLVLTNAATLPALTGFNVGNGKYGVCLFLVDQYGNLTTAYSDGTAAAIGNIVFPVVPTGKACIGFLLVPGALTGNTTALDAVQTIYFNTVGAFNPGIIGTV